MFSSGVHCMIPGCPSWHWRVSDLWYPPNDLNLLAGSDGSSFHSHSLPVAVGSEPPPRLRPVVGEDDRQGIEMLPLARAKLGVIRVNIEIAELTQPSPCVENQPNTSIHEQGPAKLWSPGCVIDAGKARQKW